ncbi:MAG: FHA domain-containing protein [Pelolinea sp.]|nr:FHA domain-containing protein [Pelolinea sp.]
MRNNLQEIEKKLQSFFEEQLQLLSGADPIKLATREMLTAQMSQIVEKNQKRFAPNIYRITFKKEKSIDSKSLESWKMFISEMIKDSARENNLNFSGPIHIQHFFDPTIQEDVVVDVAFSSISTSKTTGLMVGEEKKVTFAKKHKGYLITPHETIFTLTKKVINIGRDDGNDLVIDNLRVSRVHAQIREISGNHVLFDLDSTVGTKVNNHRVSQHTLSTGDVVEIADVALIYGTDSEHDSLIKNHSHTRVIPLQERKK